MRVYQKKIDYEKDDLGLQIQNLYAVATAREICSYFGLGRNAVYEYIYRTAYPEAAKKKRNAWAASHVEYNKNYHRKWYIENREHHISSIKIWENNNRERSRSYKRGWNVDMRKKVFQLLSNKEEPSCECCGITVALTLEHKKQNGAEERRKYTIRTIIRKILAGELPVDDYSVLCSMCNRSVYNNDVCAHIKRDDRTSYWKILHDKAIYKIGNKCFNCSESMIEFLEIEHINGDGMEERSKFKGDQYAIYRNIINDKRSIDDLRIACGNCNHILAYKPEELERAKCRESMTVI